MQAEILGSARAATDETLALFDSLPPIDLDFLIGKWKGTEISTGHPMGGLLVATRWYGKEFESSESVHPLLHVNSRGKIFRVAPIPFMLNLSLKLPVLKSKPMQPVSCFATSLLRTHVSQARLRMIEHLGVL